MYQRAFSLIELLVGLTLVGIVLLLASPAFSALAQSNHREEAAHTLAQGLRTARTEAITRHRTVVIHAINEDWSQGWRIILDASGKGSKDPDNPVLAERASGSRVPIVGNWWVKHQVRFSHLGEPLMAGEAFHAGTLHICDAREPLSQLQVVLAATGRVSLRNTKAAQALCQSGKDSKQRTNT